MIDKNIDQKETKKLKMIYTQYLDKRTDIMKKTQVKVDDVLGHILRTDNISLEQFFKFITVFRQNDVYIQISLNIILL